MRSDLQTEASRANGSKSRGPVTEEGKLASSRNAVKHGLLSECVLLPRENAEYFQDLTTEFFEEFRPVGPIEIDLVQMMLVSSWRRTRVWFLESKSLANKIADQPAAETYPAHATVLAFAELANEGRTLDLLNRYESRYDRQYFRAHRRLLEIQDRRMRNEPDNTPPPAPGPLPVVPSDPIDSIELSAPVESSEPITPSVSAGNSSLFTKRTQGEPENTENKALDTEPAASNTPATPVARRPFYLATLPAATFYPAPPENPAVFHAGTDASHP